MLAGEVSHIHKRLMDAYRGPTQVDIADVPDDGYIMQNAGHHLVHAHQLSELKGVLMRTAWLECKLISYGVASVVADFRCSVLSLARHCFMYGIEFGESINPCLHVTQLNYL